MLFYLTGQRKASGAVLFHSPPRSFEKSPTVPEDPGFWIGWQTENASNSPISTYLTGYRVQETTTGCWDLHSNLCTARISNHWVISPIL